MFLKRSEMSEGYANKTIQDSIGLESFYLEYYGPPVNKIKYIGKGENRPEMEKETTISRIIKH